jgi:hypothetical protein
VCPGNLLHSRCVECFVLHLSTHELKSARDRFTHLSLMRNTNALWSIGLVKKLRLCILTEPGFQPDCSGHQPLTLHPVLPPLTPTTASASHCFSPETWEGLVPYTCQGPAHVGSPGLPITKARTCLLKEWDPTSTNPVSVWISLCPACIVIFFS